MGTFVTVIAGSTKFQIYKELICYHSPYFSRAFNGEFLEGHTQEITITDIDSAVFGIFVHWLYTQRCVTLAPYQYSIVGYSETNSSARLSTSTGADELTAYDAAALWVLGDRFLIPTLQHHAMRFFENRRWKCDVQEDEVKKATAVAFDTELQTALQTKITLALLGMSKDREQDIVQWASWFPPRLNHALVVELIMHQTHVPTESRVKAFQKIPAEEATESAQISLFGDLRRNVYGNIKRTFEVDRDQSA